MIGYFIPEPPTGGPAVAFCPRLQPERGPRRPHEGPLGGPMKGPLNTCLNDRYTLIEQSEYSSEEQCSKLINKEIWLARYSYCHYRHVMTFVWSTTNILGEVVIQNGKPPCPWGPPLTLCPGTLNFSG